VRTRRTAELGALAALAYLPFLASDPGQVSADSKQDLYLDPGALLGRATDLWSPEVGAGTVPHQELGYLVPMGPWFWVFDRLGAPDWVAQRLWWGTLSLAAMLGARWLLGRLGAGRAGALVAALVYGLTPYQLAFTARMSVLLLPWAVLPWVVGATVHATRGRGWRWPAAAGLAVFAAGGVNASSLVLVGLAPLLWVAVEAVGRFDRRAVLAAAGRIGLLAAGLSAWWIVGLRLQAAYGLPVLQLTEGVDTVAAASTPGDVLRGLGNWFFYGRDRTGWSLDQAEAYATDRVVVAVTYALPALAIAAAVAVRWAHRAYFCLLVVAGTVVAVGAWPTDDPTLWGRLWRTFSSETSLGLALRNSPRAVPVVVLGLAGLLAGAVGAIPPDRRRLLAAGSGAAVAVAGLLPVWTGGGYLTDGMLRPEDLPSHWIEAVDAIDAGDHGTRVLELPGSSFAAYTWGTTVEPITPGLTARPYLAREVLPAGTPPSVDLLAALDRRFQLGIAEPEAIAPVARLFAVGTVVLRGDLEQAGRFDTPPPDEVWAVLRAAPDLGTPDVYGRGRGAVPGVPAVALLPVEDERPVVRVADPTGPVVLAGDGEGIVDAAAAGLLDGRALLLMASALDDDALQGALDAGAHLVLTDTNRRRIQTWFYSIRDTRGPTERAGEVAEDPTGYDFRLDPFPGTGDDHRSVVEHVGGTITGTGGRGPEAPEDRAAQAMDGDVTSAWRVAGPDVAGHHLEIAFDEPVAADRIQLVEAAVPPGARHLNGVRITVDGGAPIDVPLGDAARSPSGQEVALGVDEVQHLRIELTGTAPGRDHPVGLAEVRVADARVAESVRLPVDLLDRVGRASLDHGLDVVLTRLRTGRQAEGRGDEERRIDRRFEVPTARAFALHGTLRGDEALTEECRDDLVALDGEPLPVRAADDVRGATSDAQRFVGCTPVTLASGSHRLVTAPASAGASVDRIVLASAPGGDPAPLGVRGTVAPPDADLEVTVETSDRVEATITGDDPVWFVLAQSDSAGWSVDVDGGSVGPRERVDGYANGWLVTPDGDGPVEVVVRWRPQRLVPVGLAVSAIALVVALVLLWRSPGEVMTPVATTPTLVWRRPAPQVPHGRAVAVLVALGVVGLVIAPPAVAALGVVAAVALVAGPPWSLGLAVVGPVALGASRALSRPSLAWLAVLVLLALALVDVPVSRRAPRR